MKINQFIAILCVQALLIFSSACIDTNTENKKIVYVYKIPPQTEDGWKTASLADVGMDETPLIEFMDDLLNEIDHRIHGILIVKEDKLVFEEYFSGYAFYHGALTDFNRETKHNLASVTKSFTSALIGLAIDYSFIQNVNQKVFSFFPEYNDLNDEKKNKITLKHLLTMSSGLEWDESTYPYTDTRNDVAQLWHQNDPIRYVLSKSMVSEPGTQFLYNSGTTNVLGEVIRRTTGLRADDFADQYLFNPLGIIDSSWEELPKNVCFTSGDLKLRPRDMAKLGDLYLHGGIWQGQQIISKWWIDESTKSFISAAPQWLNWEYGYQWWLNTYEFNSQQIEFICAQGWGGQKIFIFPSLDMIVVTTAGYYDEPELEFHINVLLMHKIFDSVL